MIHYIGSRNPVTIIVFAILMGGAFLGAKAYLNSLPEAVSSKMVKAEVISLDKRQLKSRDKVGNTNTSTFMFAELKLESGKTFKSAVAQPYPIVGEKLEVTVTSYSDGSETATISNF